MNMNKSTLFWIIIVSLILVGIFGGFILNKQSKPAMSPTKMKSFPSPSGMPGTMTVEGFNFGFSPKTITVKQGDMVMLKLVSNDSPHTFTIDELGLDQQFTYGKDAAVMFTASKKGTFKFYCAVPGHREGGMVGTLVIE